MMMAAVFGVSLVALVAYSLIKRDMRMYEEFRREWSGEDDSALVDDIWFYESEKRFL